MNSPVKVVRQLKKRIQSATYGSSFYRHMLDQGPAPERLRLMPGDPWPGDAAKGQALVAGEPGLFDTQKVMREEERREALAHEWLRDLRAVGTDMARRKAVALIKDWIDTQEGWDEEMWAPATLGARLANWIAFYEFYGPMVTPAFQKELITAMVRQLRHLRNTAPAEATGVANLQVVKGLVYGGLGLLDAEKALGLALELLERQIEAEILPDGGHVSRDPWQHALILRLLIDIRGALCAGKLEVPPSLALAITQMVPVLKFFRHGDGGLALFNGSREGQPLLLDAALTLSETRPRLLKQLPHMGYERLTAGRSLLLIDTDGPPPRPYDQAAHAGLLSFEFSVGKERILTNCGAGGASDPAWRQAMASSAAHNTIIYADKNACELLPEGGVGARRPKEIGSQRYEQDGWQVVEMSHDGYMPRHKVFLQRSLSLSKEGEELRGRDIITGPARSTYAIRWHIHPKVDVLLAQGGGSALLRTASGQGWRLRVQGAAGADLALETSVYCGQDTPRRTFQLRVSGQTGSEPAIVDWVFVREKTNKGAKK